MLKSFQIKGVRELENVRADGLGAVNLFTGDNDSGKTSVLEALFLLLGRGNPELTVRLNGLRHREKPCHPDRAVGLDVHEPRPRARHRDKRRPCL